MPSTIEQAGSCSLTSHQCQTWQIAFDKEIDMYESGAKLVEKPGFSKMKDILDGAKDAAEKAVGNAADAVESISEKIGSQLDDMKAQRKQNATEKEAAKEPDQYEQAVIDYNDAYMKLNDSGMQLLGQRERTMDLLDLIESLVNSIARTPKSFEADFVEIKTHRQDFSSLAKFAENELATVRKSAIGAGAGVATGAGVAAIAPTAAMWVATTFGTASTGAAISSLSGAAATNAALAWLGGGAIAASGGGMSAGAAFLALAGPVGWTIAGATVLTSVVIITTTKLRTKKEKEKILSEVKKNTASTDRMTAKVAALLQKTEEFRERLVASYEGALSAFGDDYAELSADEQVRLVALVNSAKACAALLSERFEEEPEQASDEELAKDSGDE